MSPISDRDASAAYDVLVAIVAFWLIYSGASVASTVVFIGVNLLGLSKFSSRVFSHRRFFHVSPWRVGPIVAGQALIMLWPALLSLNDASQWRASVGVASFMVVRILFPLEATRGAIRSKGQDGVDEINPPPP